MGIACLILEEQKYSFSEEAEAAFVTTSSAA